MGSATLSRQPGALTSGSFTQTLASGWRAYKGVLAASAGATVSASRGKIENNARRRDDVEAGAEEVKQEVKDKEISGFGGIYDGEEDNDGAEDQGAGGALQHLFPWLQTLEQCGELFQMRALKRRNGGLSPFESWYAASCTHAHSSNSNNNNNTHASNGSATTPRNTNASTPLSPGTKPPLPPRSPLPVAISSSATNTATALVKQGHSESTLQALPPAPSPVVPVVPARSAPQLPHRRKSSASSSSTSSPIEAAPHHEAGAALPPASPPSPPPPDPPDSAPWLQQPTVAVTDPKVAGDTLSFEVLDLGLPVGLTAGDDLLVITPTNQRVRVAVPAGVVAGQHFRLQVPVPSPVAKRVHRFGIFVLLEEDAVAAETKVSTTASTRRRSSSGASSSGSASSATSASASSVVAASNHTGSNNGTSTSTSTSEALVETPKLTSSKLTPQGANGLVRLCT